MYFYQTNEVNSVLYAQKLMFLVGCLQKLLPFVLSFLQSQKIMLAICPISVYFVIAKEIALKMSLLNVIPTLCFRLIYLNRFQRKTSLHSNKNIFESDAS